jgi:hypothetical protein
MSNDARVGIPGYAELRCMSNFSFLKGASWPEELVERAQKLGYSALAVCDECSMAGAVRAHVEGKERGFKVIHGSQFAVDCDAPFTFIVLACTIEGYGNLCEFITGLRQEGHVPPAPRRHRTAGAHRLPGAGFAGPRVHRRAAGNHRALAAVELHRTLLAGRGDAAGAGR